MSIFVTSCIKYTAACRLILFLNHFLKMQNIVKVKVIRSQFIVPREYLALERFMQFADGLDVLGELSIHQLPALRPIVLLRHQLASMSLIHKLQLSLQITHLLQTLLIMDLDKTFNLGFYTYFGLENPHMYQVFT